MGEIGEGDKKVQTEKCKKSQVWKYDTENITNSIVISCMVMGSLHLQWQASSNNYQVNMFHI